MPDIKASIVDSRSTTVHKKGFTLIELLVVITIIGILSAISMASFTQAQAKARDSKRKTDLKAVQQAIELYFQTRGDYPLPMSGLLRCGAGDGTIHSWGTIFVCYGVTYMNPLPIDPASPAYTYYFRRTGVGLYVIYSVLENTNDPDYCDASGTGCTKLPCQPLTGYNYCVINP